MSRVRPNLNALRVFEAAARLGSFAKASADLNVTSSAVSQQIRMLEVRLGTVLFERHANGIVLTNQGRRYAEDVGRAFAMIDEATKRLRRGGRREVIIVRLPTSFASQWIAPRIDLFRQLHPEIGLEISSLGHAGSNLDAEILYGTGNFPRREKTMLMGEETFPLCSPAFARGLRSPRDIVPERLLHVRGYAEDWDSWLNHVGVHDMDTSQGAFFDQSIMAINAAVEGKGILLGRSTLVENEVASGLLVAPFSQRLKADGGYWLLVPPEKALKPKVLAFKNWLLSLVE